MVTLSEYAVLADDVYEPGSHAGELPGWEVVASVLDQSIFSGGSLFTSGFQGAAYRHRPRGELVLAFKGTRLSMFSDLRSDIALGLFGTIPLQASTAMRATADWVGGHGGSNRLSIVGHSLGGGLAQVVGFHMAIRFVTFNAPGMAGSSSGLTNIPPIASVAEGAGDVAGVNVRLKNDPVSRVGSHVGRVRTLESGHSFLTAHFQSSVISLLSGSPLGASDPFA
jgi:hypothetical protein